MDLLNIVSKISVTDLQKLPLGILRIQKFTSVFISCFSITSLDFISASFFDAKDPIFSLVIMLMWAPKSKLLPRTVEKLVPLLPKINWIYLEMLLCSQKDEKYKLQSKIISQVHTCRLKVLIEKLIVHFKSKL